MIYTSKSYKENIESPENKNYDMLVNQLMSSGSLENKYNLLLDETDICNIILLSYIKCKDYEPKTVAVEPEPYVPFPRIPKHRSGDKKEIPIYNSNPEYIKILSNISSLLSTLNFETQSQILFSIGIGNIINLLLEHDTAFDTILTRVADSFQNGNINKKTYINAQ